MQDDEGEVNWESPQEAGTPRNAQEVQPRPVDDIRDAAAATNHPKTGSWVGSSAHGGMDFQL
jgi:hypothetical protein